MGELKEAALEAFNSWKLQRTVEIKPEVASVASEGQSSIDLTRKKTLHIPGLLPNESLHVELQSHDFAFGTAISGETILAARGDEREMKRLHDKYGVDQAYVQQYLTTENEYFNGIVEKNWFKWDQMSNNPERAAKMTQGIWEYVTQHPDQLKRSRGHNVFWNRERFLPQKLQGQSKETIAKEVLEERVNVIQQFPFPEWDLVNEPIKREPRVEAGADSDKVVFDPEEDIDFFVDLFKKAKEKNPHTKLYVNEYSIHNDEIMDQYAKFIKALQDRGAPVDGIGIQMHIRPGNMKYISLDAVARNLQKLSQLGLPIKITELAASDEVVGSEAERAKYMKDLLTVFYGTPAVTGVYLWGFDTALHGRTKSGEHAGLFDNNLQPNQVGQEYFNLINNEWTTKTDTKTDASGNATFQGEPGIYTVKNQNGNSITVDLIN